MLNLIFLSVLAITSQPLQPSDETRHKQEINFVAFSPDARTLATVSSDGTTRLWNSSDCSLLHTLTATVARKPLPDAFRAPKVRRNFPIYAVTFSNAGKKVAAFSETRSTMSQLTVWNVETGEIESEITGSSYPAYMPIVGMKFAPDDRTIVCANDRYAFHWDLRNSKASKRWIVDYHPQGDVFFDKNGGPMILSGLEGVYIMDALTGRTTRSFRNKAFANVKLSSDGNFVAQTYGGTIEVVDGTSFTVLRQITPKSGQVVHFDVNAKLNSVIVLTSAGQIERWGLSDGAFLDRLDIAIASSRLNQGQIVFETHFQTDPPNDRRGLSIEQPRMDRRDDGITTFGLAAPRRLRYHAHPTPFIVSTDGTLICYVRGSQFAIVPANWSTVHDQRPPGF
ncbi:MAG: hypothetical protein KDB27_07560 [Planctomycetales bacterium]|nr:hypothetical protein [Planctomycetales bacterium]